MIKAVKIVNVKGSKSSCSFQFGQTAISFRKRWVNGERGLDVVVGAAGKAADGKALLTSDQVSALRDFLGAA
jgi:hypothetical protein